MYYLTRFSLSYPASTQLWSTQPHHIVQRRNALDYFLIIQNSITSLMAYWLQNLHSHQWPCLSVTPIPSGLFTDRLFSYASLETVIVSLSPASGPPRAFSNSPVFHGYCWSNSSTTWNPSTHYAASATTQVSVRNPWVFRMALKALMEPRILWQRITRFPPTRWWVALSTFLGYCASGIWWRIHTIRITRVLHSSQALLLCCNRWRNAWR